MRIMDVQGYEGLYTVSDQGIITSLPRAGTRGGELVFKPDKFGYLRVGLTKFNECKTFKAHRLVAMHFVSNPKNLPQVNHINGIKTDNRSINLEWVSAKQNVNHAWSLGLAKSQKGELNNNSIVTDRQREDIVRLYSSGVKTQDDIAKMYGITQSNIALIVRSYLKQHFEDIDSGLAIDSKSF